MEESSENSSEQAEHQQVVERVTEGSDSIQIPADLTKESEKETTDVRALIAEMTIPERIKLAMFGNEACRGVLIKDPNRIISSCVLGNPKIQELEVEKFANDSNLDQIVFRRISDNKSWMKNYSIKKALVMNPKTPRDIAIKWLRFITANDLKTIGKSKNVPSQIATLAKKRAQELQKGK